jgi:hypothetical protein
MLQRMRGVSSDAMSRSESAKRRLACNYRSRKPHDEYIRYELVTDRRLRIDEHAAHERRSGMMMREARTLDAIKRMVPAHARELANSGWSAIIEDVPDVVKFTVTSINPQQVIKIKCLRFMGIMVQGGHHQLHHLAMSKGEFGAHQQ